MRQVSEFEDLMVFFHLSERESQKKGVHRVRGFFLHQKSYLLLRKRKIFKRRIAQQSYLRDQELSLIRGDK